MAAGLNCKEKREREREIEREGGRGKVKMGRSAFVVGTISPCSKRSIWGRYFETLLALVQRH